MSKFTESAIAPDYNNSGILEADLQPGVKDDDGSKKNGRGLLTHIVKMLLFTFIILGSFSIIYFLLFANKTLPNTYFGNLNISGKNQEETTRIITNYIDNYEKQAQIILIGQKKLLVYLKDLGITFNKKASYEELIARQKPDNFWQFVKNHLYALVFKSKIKPSYSLNYSQAPKSLDGLLSFYESPPIDSTIKFVVGQAVASKSSNGILVDRGKLFGDIFNKIDSLSNGEITVNYVSSEPKIREDQAQRALERVRQLNSQNIELYFEREKWPISQDKLISLLQFLPSDQGENGYLTISTGGHKVNVVDIEFKGKLKPILEVKVNEQEISLMIAQIANSLNKPTVDAVIEFDGQRATYFSAASDGQELDTVLTKNLILEKISVENLSYDQNISIKLPVLVTRAKIANDEINSLGIHELVGSGVSYFAGSIPNRRFNIELGSKLISGTVVPPGEVFSFTKIVGPVSAEQGFKQAYVINKGRTVLDDGGGICQVSTTVFRAALNSGLPILKRTAHAYRVGYYEQKGFKPGFDATIFSPSVDLQFKNDTANHILVQAKVDLASSRLQVDIYGTRDGRRVEVSDAVVSNISPPPPPLNQDDPTLPKGTVKQVDFEAYGATSVFTRKVFKGDQVIIDETFKSNFRPWQSVFLIGTGG